MKFVTLPGYSNYEISECGVVRNVSGNRKLSGWITSSGYLSFSVTDDLGVSRPIGLHRMLCMAFKPIDTDVTMVVNHINGDKSDNDLDNLEWVTYKENSEHAGSLGLTEKCKPVLIKSTSTGAIKEYPSATACAKDLGLTKDAVLYRLTSGLNRVYPEGYQYRWKLDFNEWSTEIDSEYGRKKSIMVKFLKDSSVMEFKSMRTASRHLGVCEASISNWMKQTDQPVLPGLILMKLSTDNSGWRTVKDPVGEFMEGSLYRRVSRVSSDGIIKIYNKAVDCANDNGLKPTTLNFRLKSNGSKVYSDGYRYMYSD